MESGMNRLGLVLLSCVVVLLAMLWGAFFVASDVRMQDRQGSLVLVGHMIEIDPVVLDRELDSGRGDPGGVFTYQGVLSEAGGVPVVGPVALEFEVLGDPIGGGAREVISGSVVTGIMPDGSGRFQVEVALPPASVMGEYGSFGLRIRDDSDGAVIVNDIAITASPYAWLSERARVSDASDRLTNDQVHTIDLASGDFVESSLGQEPKAVRVGNMVMLTGVMTNPGTINSSSVVGTLPVGMRPSSTVLLAIHVSLSQTSGNTGLSISSNGEIRLISPTYTPGFQFFLNGANFVVE